MKKLLPYSFALPLFLLLGCSTMNAEDCLHADWEMVGMKDGQKGKLQSSIADYNKQCRKYNVIPDKRQYMLGYDKGLNSFCTKESGFSQGKKNLKNNSLCEGDAKLSFNRGFTIGQEYYAVSKEIASLESNIRSNKKSIERMVKKLKKQQEAISESKDKKSALKKYSEDYNEAKVKTATLDTQSDYLREKLAVKKYQYQELVKKYGYQ